MNSSIPDVPVRTPIRLGQFLKLADLVDSGADAAAAIGAGVVRVDGTVETRRGRQLRGGEVVAVERVGAARVTAG